MDLIIKRAQKSREAICTYFAALSKVITSKAIVSTQVVAKEYGKSCNTDLIGCMFITCLIGPINTNITWVF